jgi:hypothetical protein
MLSTTAAKKISGYLGYSLPGTPTVAGYGFKKKNAQRSQHQEKLVKND